MSLRLLELIHDEDHTKLHSNIDLWCEKTGAVTKKHLAYTDAAYPEKDSFDFLIVHGGSQHLWNKEAFPWLFQEIAFIRKVLDSGKPVIGFCLGCQLLSEACGGRVFQSKEKETGFYRVTPYPEAQGHPVLRGLKGGFETFEWHADHFTLPKGFEALAYTRAAENQIIASASVPAVGFQFHPEYTKDIIAESAGLFKEVWRAGEKAGMSTEEFLEAVKRSQDPYPLFETLMQNTIAYLSENFSPN